MGEASASRLATELPWLCPAMSSLVALADEHPNTHALFADPGLLLLALRYVRPGLTPQSLNRDCLLQPIIPEAAAFFLDKPPQSSSQTLLEYATSVGRLAATIAAETRRCPPLAAFVAGSLAPLGWLAVAATSPQAIAACQNHAEFSHDPFRTQTEVWGLSHDQIVRRLAMRWRLPTWVAGVIGNLHHEADVAESLGAEPGLFAVVREAVQAAERHGHCYGLLGQAMSTQTRSIDTHIPEPVNPLLPKLLRALARARRANGVAAMAAIEAENDRLHKLAFDSRADFACAVRDAKLAGLAELAAGAGHEINNPLAVISGNAQLLASREDDPSRKKSLDAIIRQSKRVAGILQELNQFARPPLPNRQPTTLAAIVAKTVEDFQNTATLKGVMLAVAAPLDVRVNVDFTQIRKAIGYLVQNAIEASPSGGHVTVSVAQTNQTVAIAIEDDGPGPTDLAIPHLFDPFYSGRSAGRGRGFGLPTAWRYATIHGGDVRYERTATGPTRFVLTLPVCCGIHEATADRKTA